MLKCRRLHAPVGGGLSIFINVILEYINYRGLHALERGGLSIFINVVIEYVNI
jgi:hypothetical protein